MPKNPKKKLKKLMKKDKKRKKKNRNRPRRDSDSSSSSSSSSRGHSPHRPPPHHSPYHSPQPMYQQQPKQQTQYQGKQPQQQNPYGGNQPQQQNQYQGNQQQQQQNYQQQQMQQQQQYQQQLQQQQQQQLQQQQEQLRQQQQLLEQQKLQMQKQQQQQQQQQQTQNTQETQQPEQKQQETSSNTDNDKYSNTQRDQPLSDATPSIKVLKSNKDYTEDDAKDDADTLYKAFKGFGSDKKTIAKVAGRRTCHQRLMIKQSYNKHYGQKEGFIKRLKSETSGKFQDILINLFKQSGFIDAHVIHDAMEGMGFNTDQLLEVLVTRTNQEIEDMKKVYQNKFKEPLEKRVSSETKKTFGHGTFQKFCLKILEAKRPMSGNDNENAIKEDAEMLNRQLNQSKKDEAKSTFSTVFTERSWSHLSKLAGVFQQISKKYTLMSAIEHAFGKSDTCKGMQMIVDFVTQPYDFWAKRFLKAMEGLGTNDKLLQRLVITRCEIDLFSIQQIFGQRYGKGKTLKNWIEGETSGDYERILLILCGYVD